MNYEMERTIEYQATWEEIGVNLQDELWREILKDNGEAND